jgi:hypothetical protein
VERLVAVGEAGAVCREANDKPLHVASQSQQQPLACKIDRRDQQAMARADDDQRVGGVAVDRGVNRRAAETGYVLQVLHGEKAPGHQLAIDEQVFDPLVGELEQVDAVAPGRTALVRMHDFERGPAPSQQASSGPASSAQACRHNKHIMIYYRRAFCQDFGRSRREPA